MSDLSHSWQAWIFDLDDTLLDTSGLLVPQALRRACEFLIQQKVLSSMEEGLQRWSASRQNKSSLNHFFDIIDSGDETQRKHFSEQAYRIFRAPPLPETLEPRAGGLDILEKASKQFPLFLVTQGDIDVQMNKVDRLQIIPFFKHVYYIDPFANENKLKAFSAILSHWQFDPQKVLSIGNRLDNEIALSKSLGMKTCYVRYGEHSLDRPETPLQIPDFNITELSELRPLLNEAL